MKIFLPSARDPAVAGSIDLPMFTQIIFLGEDRDLEEELGDYYPYSYTFSETEGYWNVLNEMLTNLPLSERFIWLADDIQPGERWLENAVECYELSFPDGLGLLALNDMELRWGGCAFGMTTRKWLQVIFGLPFFPFKFAHQFVDTICADRSKDLNRYSFCDSAVVEHMHHHYGKAEKDHIYKRNEERAKENGDKYHKDNMDVIWRRVGKRAAQRRLEDAKRHLEKS